MTEAKRKDHDTRYKDGQYLELHPTWHEEDSSWKAGHILRMLSEYRIAPKRICEVGCGAGEILRQLYMSMPENVEFDGYEISPQAYGLCSSKTTDRLRFHLKNITEEFDVHFDVLLLMDVMEHVEDYMHFLKLLKDTASYHCFHIPLDFAVSPLLRVTPLLRARELDGHIHYFTKEIALTSLQDAGYEILASFYTHGGIDMPGQGVMNAAVALAKKVTFALNQDWAARIFGGFGLMVLTR